MTDAFDRAVKHVLEREGGFVNHPADRGGATKFGITLATLRKFRHADYLTSDDVKALQLNEAMDIYRLMYWVSVGLDRVEDSDAALILFDFGVNAGPKCAVIAAQRVLNELGELLQVDGDLGTLTLAALSAAQGPKLNRKLIQAMQLHYARLCVGDPRQLAFLQGWLNRTFALQDAVA